jgi:phospholipase A1
MKSIITFFTWPLFCTFLFVNSGYADEMKDCLLEQLLNVPGNTTAEEIRTTCEQKLDNQSPENAIAKRIAREREAQWNPFTITAHKQNYILPITHATGMNVEAYDDVTGGQDVLDDNEAKFQLSLKIPLNYNKLFVQNDALYFGFTVQSYWQIYNDGHSSPFRETNYQPELFYARPLSWKVAGGDTGLVLGIEHQSNGRSDPLSRSWNRTYATFLWANENLAMSLRGWVRISEDEEDDDNPDIDDYMGNFEYKASYKWRKMTYSGMLRQNFSEGNGAVELGMSFPIYGRLNGYIQYFNGYGESLIDYNHNVERIGLGILLTDLL